MKKIKALTVPEGDGVMVKRLMPIAGLRNFDPFVLCDHFDIDSGGFPDHPHRGFEAITYMLDGGMQHADNLGNRSTVTAGGLQRFTAGKGLIHSEIPSGRAVGLQLWINLPQSLKKIEPDYQQVNTADIPVLKKDGVCVKTLVGKGSPTLLKTPLLYLDLSIDSGHEHRQLLPVGFRGFVYVLEGEATLDQEQLNQSDAVLIENTASITLKAVKQCRLILCFGQPHGEPIYQHGPYVD